MISPPPPKKKKENELPIHQPFLDGRLTSLVGLQYGRTTLMDLQNGWTPYNTVTDLFMNEQRTPN
jgi:hypothetical protein